MEKKDIIKQISYDTRMSVSSIYKILANPIQFSSQSVDMVRQAAERHGLSPSVPPTGGEASSPQHRHVRIGITIPSRPLRFWQESVQGFKVAQEQLAQHFGITIELQFVYHRFPFNQTDNEQLFRQLREQLPDGQILFPVEGATCRDYIESLICSPRSLPLVIFNDLQDYMTPSWFDAQACVSFVGTDNYNEGCKAASLAMAQGPDIHRLVAIYMSTNTGAQSSRLRVQGFCDSIHVMDPAATVNCIEIDPTVRTAASELARKMEPLLCGGTIDCIYLSNGGSYIGGSALEKLERRLGRHLPTLVIGHELLGADKKYLLQGRECGYIKQDVYQQSYAALQDILCHILWNQPMCNRLYPSSVFIR